jgi:hypothetical protein
MARRSPYAAVPGPNADALRSESLSELIAANDPSLERLLRASGEERESEISRLITEIAAPVVWTVLSRYTRRSSPLRSDAGDIAANVTLRLIVKLRDLGSTVDGAVQDFPRYVAGVTYNAVHDHLRTLFPARARLKQRLRYSLLRDPRLATWTAEGALCAGLAEQRDREPLPGLSAPQHLAAVRDESRTADALVALLRHHGAPAFLDEIVDALADLWQISDVKIDIAEISGEYQPVTPDETGTDHRDYLQALWVEIKLLRPLQRKALLLNLRSADSVNVIAVFVQTGIVTFNEMAAALEQTPAELAELWNDLPLADQTIAALLGVTRQQVINLRKAARHRLTRRMERQ